MGVPKFYRWISERYPCLSEVVKEYQIPEFDNLYLDMNGIIHICSHPNDDDPHFRISEEDIFKDIFHYIEVLFRMIQPTKVFYMAIDGVAPRAKMNQQRGRRFRSAREAEENEKKALAKGETLPSEARFDSNCITPGTDFMTKLDAQLQYFITSKMSTDKLWDNCTVIYSGHKTPGEGEHKIMEYIRFSKSQPGYDANTRHCLYGLDADLMMLGLTSHEPHFSLLREEVRFGGKKSASKRTPTPEETTFHLLHLSLMREYIEYEFYELRETLPFKFDIESVIDDWVLMGFLVGNDFIPHLPGLHINKDALPILYEKYKEVLPTLDGYLNEGGTLHLKRFEKFMSKLTEYDVEKFHEFNDNLKYIRCKKGGDLEDEEIDERMARLEKFDFEDDLQDDTFGSLEDNPLTKQEVRAKLARLDISQVEDFFDDDDDSDNDDEDSQFEAEFRQHKRHYYMTKMSFEDVTPDVLRDQATNYIRGLQWILNYYYNGICSWSWYYPHHYAPYISDVKDFSDIDVSFDKGTPFMPFEQLLAVLPPLSVKLLPKAYGKLMLSESSPLWKYYPKEFETDLNGKQQDWEAVVLIPFINEEELLSGMKPCNELLTPEEKARNSHGPMYLYRYTSENLGEYKAPGYFPDIGVNHAGVRLVWREEWDIHPADMIKGLLPGIRLDLYFAGFPTLKHLEHTFRREKASVKVFQQDSRGENFILEVVKQPSPNIVDLLKNVLGKSVFVNWPHLIEAKIVAISSEKSKYYVKGENNDTPNHEELDPKQVKFWHTINEDLKSKYLKRWGVDIDETEYILYGQLMSGRNYVAGHDGKITLEKKWCEFDQPFPLQTIIRDITVHDPGYKQYKTIQEYFEPGSKVFMMGHPFYGCMGEVIEIDPQHKGRIRVSMVSPSEPNLDAIFDSWKNSSERYMTAYECSISLGISPNLFARLTGSIFLAAAQELNPFMDIDTINNKLNVGLNLKSNKRSEEVIGFTKKSADNKQWYYSEQCVKALQEYQKLFPEIFMYLNRNPMKNDVFQDEVFPKNYKERVPELTKWLKESSFTSAERCKWGTVFVDSSVVSQIADEVERVSKQRAKPVKMQIKPHLLFKPNPLQGSTPPDTKVTFELFDRIINVREGFSVPLGATGTIIGIQPAEKQSDKVYVVFFDKAFNGGLTLAGPAFPFRCYRLSWASVINLSHGQRINGVNSMAGGMRPAAFATPMERPTLNQGKYSSVIAQNTKRAQVRSPTYNTNRTEKVQIGSNSNLSSYTSQSSSIETNTEAEDIIAQLLMNTDNSKPRLIENKAANSLSDQPISSITKDTSAPDQINEVDGQDYAQPPNPNQLPQPICFRDHLLSQTNKNNNEVRSFHSETNAVSSNNSKKSQVRQIVNENDVSLVIHGNFYENWDKIKESGIQKDHRHYIPCVSYIPPNIGSRTYEIHIYLNIKKLLSDGIRLLLFQKGQVLCSSNRDGLLPPKYFEKVVDTKDGSIIYTSSPPKEPIFQSPPPMRLRSGEVYPIGIGRGAPRLPAPPMAVFENIWSQMQTMDPTLNGRQNTPNRCPSNPTENPGGRKEVSVNELFRFASLNIQAQPSIPPSSLPVNYEDGRFSLAQAQSRSPPKNASDKAQFVPRQVERKQTPKKMNASPPSASSQVRSPPRVSQHPIQMFQNSPKEDSSSTNATGRKPKKKHRSRIAANFGFQNSEENN